MLLTDRDIRKLAKESFEEARISLVDPFIFPFDDACVNPTSYDLKIGYTAGHLRSSYWNKRKVEFKPIKNFKDFTKQKPYWLKPNDYILVAARESINLPSNVSAEVKLKSSRAREGLSHALAGWVDPGFHGVLTLELKNYLKDSYVPIYPEMKIVQLIYYSHKTVDKSYADGRYAGKTSVLASLDQFKDI